MCSAEVFFIIKEALSMLTRRVNMSSEKRSPYSAFFVASQNLIATFDLHGRNFGQLATSTLSILGSQGSRGMAPLTPQTPILPPI
jgi:hypothetical protein